jgi:hypothetical protein
MPTPSKSGGFWIVWVPPLIMGFVVGYVFHDFLDFLYNIGGMR